MFYLTYRPQIIQDIDNTRIREKLTLLLKSKKIPHAFLFTGPKGAGKTSAARLIAKAVNCQNNVFSDSRDKKNKFADSIEPCNECENCISITKGNAVDVIELDAASNRKIDEIRDLIDKIKFSPLYCRYKVYIIDEVHMLTTEAFNALLKTLEEPPESTLFILATTELDKLPKTIISRCIHFNFGNAEVQEIVSMLKRISKHENLDIEDKALEFIAERADHSFRDATKILEEAVMSNQHTISGIKNVLGLSGSSLDLLQAIEKKDPKAALTFLKSYDENGGSFKTLIETLLERFHQILRSKNGLSSESTKMYTFSLPELSYLMKSLQETYNLTKISPIESLPLEICLLEYFEKKK
jgi:DNA polymerase-3 subunit gamma/tau